LVLPLGENQKLVVLSEEFGSGNALGSSARPATAKVEHIVSTLRVKNLPDYLTDKNFGPARLTAYN
jgi:hypothetical protein